MPKKGSGKKSGRRGAHVEEEEEEEEVKKVSEDEDEDARKYGRRKIQSNWEKYRAISPSEDDCGADESTSTDFASLLNASSDCSYFQFKHEKKWESEALNSRFNKNKLFNLNLEMLAGGLACIPFYERMGIDKSCLSGADVEKCDSRARDSLARYDIVRDKFLKKLALDYQLPEANGEAARKTVTESEKVEVVAIEAATSSPEPEPPKPCRKTELTVTQADAECDDAAAAPAAKSGEENLEDWLDSVLDD